MAHDTEKVSGLGMTSEEQKILIKLLKHPKIKKMVEEEINEEEKQ